MYDDKKVIWAWDDVFSIADEYREEYPELSEEDLLNQACDDNMFLLDDMLLSARGVNLGNGIICIADLGLWNGRVSGYKEIKSIEGCFDSIEDRGTWYIEDGEFKCDDCHHDGTNHYTYRMLKDIDFYDFNELYYDTEDKESVINKYTVPMGDFICNLLDIQ